MNVIHAPIPVCRTRMRQNYSFGKDDPLLWPQPFYLPVGHLAVIPVPMESPPYHLRLAWYTPSPADIISVTDSALVGTGNLALYLTNELTNMCTELLQRISQLESKHRVDAVITQTKSQLKKYLERLSMRGTRNELCLLISCIQRVFLGLYARVEWLVKWFPCLSDPDQSHASEVDDSVMGAFTDNLDIAGDLFRLGIPLWLVRPKSTFHQVNILRLVGALDENPNHLLPIRGSSSFIDVSDSSPPHRTLYTGLPGRFTRYIRMAGYVYQQFNHSVLGEPTDADPVQFVSPPVRAVGSTWLAPTAGLRFRPTQGALASLSVMDTQPFIFEPPMKRARSSMFSFL